VVVSRRRANLSTTGYFAVPGSSLVTIKQHLHVHVISHVYNLSS